MATEHDQLATRLLESNALSKERSSIELTPLEKLIARVQVRWPHPEMGDLEYLDWKESLRSCPLEKIQAALDRIATVPPKTEHGEYRGRPTLIDVLRTMDILAEEGAAEFRRQQAETSRRDWRRMEKRRQEHPEEFFGLADVLKAANVVSVDQAAKPMPAVRTIFPDIDPGKNAEKLKQQAEIVKQKYKQESTSYGTNTAETTGT